MLKQIAQKLLQHQPRCFYSQRPQAAVLIPLTDEPCPKIIFTRRAVHLSTHGGEVAFPGGKQEADDPSLEITALRESHEEINLPPEAVNILGRTGSVISRFGLEVTPFVGLIPADTRLEPNQDELDIIFRVPLVFFLDSDNLHIDPVKTAWGEYPMPAYQYEDHRIWGLTALILVEFLNITLDARIPLQAPQLTQDVKDQRQLSQPREQGTP